MDFATSRGNMSSYLDGHNAYVQQLTATNAMIEQYQIYTLPRLMEVH